MPNGHTRLVIRATGILVLVSLIVGISNTASLHQESTERKVIEANVAATKSLLVENAQARTKAVAMLNNRISAVEKLVKGR